MLARFSILFNFVSEFTDEFLYSAWQMSSLLLLKASHLCLRVPPVSEKMHKGIIAYMLNCNFYDTYPLEMHLKKNIFCLPRSTNSFSIKYQAWFTNGRKCWKFLGCFPPFHPNTSRKEVHLNTFHKNMFYHNEKFIFVSSLWHSLVSGESGLMMKFWFICQLRFIQLREDYKSAKLAARLSSLWPSSS